VLCFVSSKSLQTKGASAERFSRILAYPLRRALSLDRPQDLALVSLYLARFLLERLADATLALVPA